jgi:hypothetical protein
MRENGDGGGGVVTECQPSKTNEFDRLWRVGETIPPVRSPSSLMCKETKKERDEAQLGKVPRCLSSQTVVLCSVMCVVREVGSETKRKRQSISLRRFLIGRRFPFFCRSGSSRTQWSLAFQSIDTIVYSRHRILKCFFFFAKNCHQRDEEKTKKSRQRPSLSLVDDGE